jgi:uncharacterized UBP type Zn finger protein
MGLLDQLKSAVSAEPATCDHLEAVGELAKPRSDTCEECGAKHSLRVCLTCGHVGCCDSSKGHATAHARETGHPVIRSVSISPFTYCYRGHGYL